MFILEISFSNSFSEVLILSCQWERSIFCHSSTHSSLFFISLEPTKTPRFSIFLEISGLERFLIISKFVKFASPSVSAFLFLAMLKINL
jgi:hypothetical protein